MGIFLDTFLLSDSSLLKLGGEVAKRLVQDNIFCESVISHFQILSGYAIAGSLPMRYEEFLRKTNIEIVPLTKSDAEEAANFKPARADLLDALIAAPVKRHNAVIWTTDRDFLGFLPKDNVRIF